MFPISRRLCLWLLACSLLAAQSETALDRYVRSPDPAYRYSVVAELPGSGYTAHLLDMVSQNWRSTEDVDRSEWRHWLTVVRPPQLKTSTALLFISGGSNDGKQPARADAQLAAIATMSGAVAAELRMVPNQPLVFHRDGKRRTEDDLIAYGWDRFLRGGDALWLARLPMTKAAVRAMDTVTDFCRTQAGGGANVDRFVVAGASKRGWTTWTTAAVDRRVVAVAPIVIDMLNTVPSFQHHWRAYGFWAPAVKDYTNAGIMDWFGRPRMDELLRIVEPYSYRERLTMPKFIINSAGDDFFLPDSWRFYFHDLPGEKYLRYVPNTDHSLRNSDVWQSLAAWFGQVAGGTPRPRFTWTKGKDGTLTVKTTDAPAEVKLWEINNPSARDFRLTTTGPKWTSQPLAGKKGRYVAKPRKPARGFTAYFIELSYPSGGKFPLKFTTGVCVTPDVLPFPPYQPKQAP